jgi:hypothetical protein
MSIDPTIYSGEAMPHPIGTISGGRDENGEITSTLQYRVEDELAAETYKLGEKHPTLGIPESSRGWEEIEPCGMGFELSIVYKGKREEDKETSDVTLDASFSEEPLKSHPNFLEIKKKYKGWINAEGEIEFPEKIKVKSGGLSKKKKTIKNPMFGVDTYLVLSAVVRHTYTSNSRPRLSKVGRIVKSVPGGFETPEDHDWLVMPPRSGNKGVGEYVNTDEYLLSPLGGWPEGVHSLMEGKWEAEPDGGGDPLNLGSDPFTPFTGWSL